MMEGASNDRNRVASASLATATAIVFVAASALLSFAPDRSSAPDGWHLRGALGSAGPLPAPTKPV